eukprot:34023-Eustigmatos_ZCMA.PRE.1
MMTRCDVATIGLLLAICQPFDRRCLLSGGGRAAGQQPPAWKDVADEVISKSGLASEDLASLPRPVDPEPYFTPLEYLYLSRAMTQRHHVRAPLSRKENRHFTVNNLDEVMLEPEVYKKKPWGALILFYPLPFNKQ